MRRPFPVYEPKVFFEKFVRRAYEEFLATPLDDLRAKTVVHQLNVMAERYWQYFRDADALRIANAPSPAAYRRFLVAQKCLDFQLVWDVDDGHKHVELGRNDRRVSSAGQSGVRKRGGALGSMALGEAPIGGTADEFVVVLDDGTERLLCQVLENVVEMWESIILEPTKR